MRLIFVYGTLKRNYGLNRVLVAGKGKFITDAVTVEKFSMLDAGYPVVVRRPALARVAGEIWLVPDTLLPELDRIEGAYTRETVQVLGGGHTYDADMYIGKLRVWQSKMPRHVPIDGVLVWPFGRPRLDNTDVVA